MELDGAARGARGMRNETRRRLHPGARLCPNRPIGHPLAAEFRS